MADDNMRSQEQEAPEKPGGSDRRRAILAIVLVVLTSLSAASATIAFWIHQTALDTDSFMETVEPALDDPRLTNEIAAVIADDAVTALALETRIENSLHRLAEFLSSTPVSEEGSPTSVLAPAITSAIETRLASLINSLIQTEQFQALLYDAVRFAHIGVVAVVRADVSDVPGVSVTSDGVNLNVVPLVAALLSEAGVSIGGLDLGNLPDNLPDEAQAAIAQLGSSLGVDLPDDFGQITVMPIERLVALRESVEQLDRFVWVTVILTFVLGALALFVSTRKGRTGIQLAVGVTIGLVLGLIGLRWVESTIVAAITDPSDAEAVSVVLSTVLGSLRSLIIALALLGGLAALGGFLASRKEVLSSNPSGAGASDFDLWVARHYDVVVFVGVAIAVVALLVVGFSLVSLVIAVALLAVYLWIAWAARSRVATPEPVSVE